MEARVLKAFRDAETLTPWKPGETYEGSPERVRQLEASGMLAAAPEEPGLGALSVKQLAAICAEEGIKCPSKATKAQLIGLIENTRRAE